MSALTDREDRLTAICNVLGHPSLSSLEDFIFLHGSNFKLTPAPAHPTNASQDTQTQFPPAALTDSLQQTNLALIDKARARKRDLRRAEGELERVRAQVGFLEGEREREVGRREEAERDWRRMEEVNRALVAEKEAGRVEGEEARGEAEENEAGQLAEQVDKLNAELDQLRADLSVAEGAEATLATELGPLREANDQLQTQLASLELALDTANAAVADLTSNLLAQQDEIVRLGEAAEELDDGRSRAESERDLERTKREQAEQREEVATEGRRVAEREVARLRAFIGDETVAGSPIG